MSVPRPLLEIGPPPPDSPWDLVLRTRREEPRLRARTAATLTRVSHPGTVVRYQDELFEVVARAADEGTLPWLYGLTRLDAATTIRVVFDLSPEGLARYEAEVLAEDARARRLASQSLLLPLVGLLPRHRLLALERETGLNPRRAVVVSALSFLLTFGPLAIYGGIAIAQGAAGGDLWVPPPWLYLLSLGLTVDAIVRFLNRDPLGSAPVKLAVLILEETHVLRRPPDEARAAAVQTERRAGAAHAHLVDRLTRMPAVGGGSEIVVESRRAKSWPDGIAIRLDADLYRVAERRIEERKGGSIHVYRLVPAGVDEAVRGVIPYRPDEALVARDAERHRDFAERLRVFKPLLGFLPGEVQARWASEHGFDARGATLMSAALEIVVAMSNLGASVVNRLILSRRLGFETLVAAFAGLLLIEGLLRVKLALEKRMPSGTFLLAWTAKLMRRPRS